MTKDFYLVLALTIVTLALWTGFETYYSYQRYEIPSQLVEISQPLDLTLNESVLDKLKAGN